MTPQGLLCPSSLDGGPEITQFVANPLHLAMQHKDSIAMFSFTSHTSTRTQFSPSPKDEPGIKMALMTIMDIIGKCIHSDELDA